MGLKMARAIFLSRANKCESPQTQILSSLTGALFNQVRMHYTVMVQLDRAIPVNPDGMVKAQTKLWDHLKAKAL